MFRGVDKRTDPVNILFITRLFSGFESSVLHGKWNPTGAPTIYKLLDALIARDDDVNIVWTCKTDPDPCGIEVDQFVDIRGLRDGIWLLAGPSIFRNWPKRLRWYLSELRQTGKIIRAIREHRPDLLYVDRGNIVAAGLIARFSKIKVVYRMMGVTPDIAAAWQARSLYLKLIEWLLRSPFSLVTCSQDGSGGEIWLDRLLSPNTPRLMLLNGVNLPEGSTTNDDRMETLPDGKTIVLLLGRLDTLKYPVKFLEGFRLARKQCPGQFHAIIVGDGPLGVEMRKKAESWGMDEDITFLGSVDHLTAQNTCKLCDIYVSLNSQGNLSNANLEAFRSGCCAIVPGSDAETGRDTATDSYFPPDTLYRIPSRPTSADISDAILHLHYHEAERFSRRRKTLVAANAVIHGWPERINREIQELEIIING
jgi:glycosyltransferase involved in cell wall biosynthesis